MGVVKSFGRRSHIVEQILAVERKVEVAFVDDAFEVDLSYERPVGMHYVSSGDRV